MPIRFDWLNCIHLVRRGYPPPRSPLGSNAEKDYCGSPTGATEISFLSMSPTGILHISWPCYTSIEPNRDKLHERRWDRSIRCAWRNWQQRTPHIDFEPFQRIWQCISTVEVKLPRRLSRFARTAIMHARPPLLGFSNSSRHGLPRSAQGMLPNQRPQLRHWNNGLKIVPRFFMETWPLVTFYWLTITSWK